MKKSPLLFSLALLLTAPFAAVPASADDAVHKLTSKLEWRSIGPFLGGRVVAVAGVPSDPNLFYFGGVQGGVWRSTDYGNEWVNLSDGKIAAHGPIHRRPRGRSLKSRRSSTRHGRDATFAATSTRATASTSRSTPARPGRTPACATRTRPRASSSIRRTRTSSTPRRSGTCSRVIPSAASSRRPTAARLGARFSSSMKTRARTTSSWIRRTRASCTRRCGRRNACRGS